MIVNHSKNFIFLKTWKTAGSAVQTALIDHCGKGDLIVDADHPHPYFLPDLGHSSATLVRDYTGDLVWNSYFKFGFVRNPWDVYVSGYWWRSNARLKESSFDEIKEDFTVWLTLGLPRLNWDILAIDGRVAVDFVGRYENLARDLDRVGRAIKATIVLPDRFAAESKGGFRVLDYPYQDYYTERTKTFVEQKNYRLINAFNYSF